MKRAEVDFKIIEMMHKKTKKYAISWRTLENIKILMFDLKMNDSSSSKIAPQFFWGWGETADGYLFVSH